MKRARPAQEQRAFLRFVEAVHDFSDDPGPANLERCLAASWALEQSRLARPAPSQARAKKPKSGRATEQATGRVRDPVHRKESER
jgi:hypothetical protein